MRLFIRKLVLWASSEGHAPREVTFEPGKINLVTGPSGTGKSAILAIVDYVLGSGKCAIPVGPIREAVSWYGLLVHVGEEQMLIARREPGARRSSSEYFVSTGKEVSIPTEPSKNTTLPAFKNHMDRLAGLPTIGFDAEGTGSGFLARPSFRDMAAFNFLPQYIVANPSALFFKTDTSEHRSKLKTMFPFVLGAVDAKHLEAEHERADLERQLRVLRAELSQRHRASSTWRAEAHGLYNRAVELGLIKQEGTPPETEGQYLALLSDVPGHAATAALPLPAPGATERAALQLQALRAQEAELAEVVSSMRARIGRIDSLRRSTADLYHAQEEGSDRVTGVGWFARMLGESSQCPVCNSDHDTAVERLQQLVRSAEALAAEQGAARQVPARLEAERTALANEARGLEERLRELRIERAQLEEAREEAGGQRLDQVYRFVGRIEQALGNLEQSSEDSDLQNRIEAAEARLGELQRLLEPGQKRRRLESALKLVENGITHYARFLELERSGEAISLKLQELTLVFQSPTGTGGRPDYLWEVGSGANWMGYHISTMLGLHEQLVKMEVNYVPTFLMVDQPSQVYYPSGIPDEATFDTPDVRETRRVFEALEEGLRRTDYQLQVIVVEHADENTLGGVQTLHVVENWHGDPGGQLIPSDWIAE